MTTPADERLRRIEIVPADPAWRRRFVATAADLLAAAGPVVRAVEHVGSTAVPGFAAKPVVDVLLVVDDLDGLADCRPALEAAGFAWRGELGIAGRRFLVRGTPTARRDHVHAFTAAAPEAARHRDFRDHLAAHPAARETCAALKRALAARRPDDVDAYCDGKHAFVRQTRARARRWRSGQTAFGP